jgi:hypothetical protein
MLGGVECSYRVDGFCGVLLRPVWLEQGLLSVVQTVETIADVRENRGSEGDRAR